MFGGQKKFINYVDFAKLHLHVFPMANFLSSISFNPVELLVASTNPFVIAKHK